jgi:hypothetical protein
MYGRRGGIAQCTFKIGDDTLQQQREIFQVEVIETPSAQKFSCRLELSWNYSANSIPEPPNSFGKSLSFIKPSRM